jgi:hypothetical protein
MPTPLKKKPVPAPGVRDLLFGDLPLSQWPLDAGPPQKGEPWASFRQARGLIEKGDAAAAKGALNRVLEMPRLESRHYLEAWQHLRGLGQLPPAAERKRVLGVVVEVGLEKGVDLVAAYEDGSARYLNFSGAGVVWEKPDGSLDARVQALLGAGRAVAGKIGPSTAPRPPAPGNGRARINMLTPGGIHFGEGPFEALSRDPQAAPVLREATALMEALVAKTGHGG